MQHLRIEMPLAATCEEAFDLLHDYGARLEWDTMLREAYVIGGTAVGVGTIAVCTGRRWLGSPRFETVYVSFQRGVVAAVKATRCPWFFGTWAASLRHEPLGPEPRDGSRVIYTVTFSARPRWLAFVMEPLLAIAFRIETRRRLRTFASCWAQRIVRQTGADRR